MADALTRAGFFVCILDRRHPCLGSTAASTALLQFEIDTPLIELSSKIGRAKAERAWRRSYSAVADLRRKTRELGISCDFRSRNAIYLPGNLLGNKDLEKEAIARQRIDLPSEFLTGAALRRHVDLERNAAIVSSGSADVDPVKLSAGLLRRSVELGARIFSPVTVADIAPRATGVDVATADERNLSCRHLIFATGYEVPKGVPMDGHKINSTWAIATRPQPELLWHSRQLIWEAADPYLYIRTTVDGRVIAGGEDQEIDDASTRDALTSRKTAAIQRKLERLLPSIDATPEFRWAGFFGESSTGLPTIGAVPGMRNCYAVLGYGGNGITFSMIAAQVIQRTLCGIADPDADLFKFD